MGSANTKQLLENLKTFVEDPDPFFYSYYIFYND